MPSRVVRAGRAGSVGVGERARVEGLMQQMSGGILAGYCVGRDGVGLDDGCGSDVVAMRWDFSGDPRWVDPMVGEFSNGMWLCGG